MRTASKYFERLFSSNIADNAKIAEVEITDGEGIECVDGEGLECVDVDVLISTLQKCNKF